MTTEEDFMLGLKDYVNKKIPKNFDLYQVLEYFPETGRLFVKKLYEKENSKEYATVSGIGLGDSKGIVSGFEKGDVVICLNLNGRLFVVATLFNIFFADKDEILKPDKDEILIKAKKISIGSGQCESGIVPVGSVIPWNKNAVNFDVDEYHYAECNGQTIDIAPLFVGGMYDNGNGTMTLPNLNGENRFLRGNDTSGGTGGSATHTLTVDELPSHTHSIYGSWSYNGGASGAGNVDPNDASSGGSNMISTATGNNQAHNNEPQYYNQVMIMRIR